MIKKKKKNKYIFIFDNFIIPIIIFIQMVLLLIDYFFIYTI